MALEEKNLSVREISPEDIKYIVDYWLNSESSFLSGMGVDLSKIPSHDQLTDMLSEQLQQSYPEKKSYCIIWVLDGIPVGHCNVNKIIFGEEAFMHLHAWYISTRGKGYGSRFVKMSIPYFFNNLKLQKLLCEPYALNPSPNRTLEKTGFEFIKEYTTVPGYLNFEQAVKRWEMSEGMFKKMSGP